MTEDKKGAVVMPKVEAGIWVKGGAFYVVIKIDGGHVLDLPAKDTKHAERIAYAINDAQMIYGLRVEP